MGNCSFKHDDESGVLQNLQAPIREPIAKLNFNFLYVIGRGGFGQVWKVQMRKTQQHFALKEMSKARIIDKRSVPSVINERKLLAQLKHPFLVNMNYAFQDQHNIYLVSDLLSGGDLRYHIGKKRKFNEQQTKFMLACMIVGLEYMHGENVIHRDIKPENIVMQENGYLRITDMGIARILKSDNSSDTSGTPGYMAPEVMCRQAHGVAVDYFALGVIGYEFMLGRRPYVGRTRKEIRDMLFAKQVSIKKHELPEGWSMEAADFINKLLQRKPQNRLGFNGPSELKNHIWLRDYDWQALLDKKLVAPYKPEPNTDNFDKAQAENKAAWKDEFTPEQVRENQIMLRRPSIQALFEGYEFDASLREIKIQTPVVMAKSQKEKTMSQSAYLPRRQTLDATTKDTTQPQIKKQYEQDLASSYNSHINFSQILSGTQHASQQPPEPVPQIEEPLKQKRTFSISTNILKRATHVKQAESVQIQSQSIALQYASTPVQTPKRSFFKPFGKT